MFGTGNFKFRIGSSLVKDITKYKLGVHTGLLKISYILILYSENNDLRDLGTSLYETKYRFC